MSYSLLCLSKIFLFFILVIFLSSFAYSLKIGISPPNIGLNGTINQQLCQDITLYSDKKVNLVAGDFWADSKSRKIEDYNLSSQDLGIKTEYTKQVTVKSKNKLNFCITASKSGDYNGALIYKLAEDNAELGIWIKLNIISEEESLSRLTGEVIQLSEDKKVINTNPFLIYTLLSCSGLLLVLLFFIRKYKKRILN